MASISTRWVLGGAMVALAACSADERPSTTGAAPPVIGDVGATPAPAQPATAAPTPPGPAAPGPAATTPTGTEAPSDGSPRYVEASILDGFQPKVHCNNIKLSQCSAYGSKFNRLDSVKSFCTQLGGEVTTYCPADNVVARCITDADVLVHYYSVGEKPVTKEVAEAKCADPARKSRIIR